MCSLLQKNYKQMIIIVLRIVVTKDSGNREKEMKENGRRKEDGKE